MISAVRIVAVTLILAAGLASSASAQPQMVVWAWERPEDLRFLPPGVEVAAQTGFVELSGAKVLARGRRFPLRLNSSPQTALVHIQIDHREALAWTPSQRASAAAAVLALGRQPWARRLQIDFEVRRSERQVLLDLLKDVRAGLPASVSLSMTALASWCQTESWLDQAPVDEVVPMLFRMGARGERLKAKLAGGGDFAQADCRGALAISTDAPLRRAPAERRIYLFSPRSWRADDFHQVRKRIEEWSSSGG